MTELAELVEGSMVLLTGSEESFFCTVLLDTVALVLASAVVNGATTVGNLAPSEGSSA